MLKERKTMTCILSKSLSNYIKKDSRCPTSKCYFNTDNIEKNHLKHLAKLHKEQKKKLDARSNSIGHIRVLCKSVTSYNAIEYKQYNNNNNQSLSHLVESAIWIKQHDNVLSYIISLSNSSISRSFLIV